MNVRVPLLLALVGLGAGCDGSQYRQNLRKDFVVEQGDFNSIAKASFKLIDSRGAITTLVVPTDIDPRARTALKDVFPIVDVAQIPPSTT